IDQQKGSDIVAEALRTRGAGWLSTEECRELLSAFRIPQVEGAIARTADEAASIAQSLGFPVAAKLASQHVLHKSDIGAVRLNLRDENAVRQVFDEIRQPDMEGILIQKMLSSGVEVMIGVTEDPLFGPLIAFGLGGIYVEILGDVRFRV